MAKRIIILGGGVAGMSAAHELIERGFEVEVYEMQPKYVGGKARSTDVAGSSAPDKKPLPGEHGFRFFPGFYRHVTDTMSRIPFEGNKRGVLDNLVSTDRITMGREGQNEIITLANFPKSLSDLKVMMSALKNAHTGLTTEEINTFTDKIWQLMTSCYQRRLEEYEGTSWWEFTNASNGSEAYNEFFVGGITRTLVAAKPRKVSTRTGGDILLQLIFQMSNPMQKVDRVLNAPTNEAWLYPWRDYLISKGVQYHHGYTVTDIHCAFNKTTSTYRIDEASVKDEKGATVKLYGDYYIAAMPVEQMAKLVDDNLLEGDQKLESIKTLAQDVAWMTGMQFYLTKDIPIARGHVMIVDSPWGITAISQPQFWPDVHLSEYGHGNVKGILSIDISDWDKPGYNGKMAKECTKQEIMEEVWCQVVLGVRKDGEPLLNKQMVVMCNLDRDIVYKDGSRGDEQLDVSKLKDCTPEIAKDQKPPSTPTSGNDTSHFLTQDKEPLLVNRVHTWDLRPNAYCNIPNLYFASDYVRTNTDLATMEGANEAARRAVNAILDLEKSSEKPCKIWKLHEPWFLWPFRYYDKIRFKKGLPWNEHFPWLFGLLHWLFNVILKIIKLFRP